MTARSSGADTTADGQALLHALSGRAYTVSFAGHLHATEHHYLGRPPASPPVAPAVLPDASPMAPIVSSPLLPHHHHVLTAARGSSWSGPRDQRGIPCADSTDGTPNGFHVLSVEASRYATRFVPAALSGRSCGC